MPKKATSMIIYMIYALFSAAIYGLISFFVIYRGLAGEVSLYAYLWNIAFIILFLLLDKIANEVLLSKEYIITEKNYFIAGLVHSISFISFKATLYLFYSFILIFSRVSLLEPGLISGDFKNFILSIEYCLILVVTFDKFIEYLSKNETRIKRITAKFDKFANYIAKKRGKR